MKSKTPNLSDTEEVDVTAPNGRVIKCIARGSVLVPKGKIEIYACGKVLFPEHEELAQLRKERRPNQQKFSKNLAKVRRLDQLERKEGNQRNSLNNLAALLKVGMSDSAEDMAKIVEHLLDIGEQVTINELGKLLRSKLAAPLGLLTVLSAWKVIDHDKKYLTTIKFIPPKTIQGVDYEL